MRVPFIKMQGLGNDFVVLDGRVVPVPAVDVAAARALADRRTGIGCDQLILLEPSASADFRMRIFNADGGEVEACGNATRAIGLLHGQPARIETLGGIVQAVPGDEGVAVNMGVPRLEWQQIPLAYAMDTLAMPVGWPDRHGALENPVAVNVGNPHAVFFVEDCDTVRLDTLGPLIEHDALFPERVNVNVATVESRKAIRLRVWERGAGETRACGTGACATAIAAMRRGLTDRAVHVHLQGGTLAIEWRGDGTVIMTGPASESFRGTFESTDFGMPA